MGLKIYDRKCELYCPSGDSIDFPTPVTHDGTIILGIPVGKSEFVRSRCVDIAKSGEELCCELAKLNNRQSSMLILRHCHVPRLNYLARQVFPDDLEAAANIHDNMTKSTFVQIIGFNHLNDSLETSDSKHQIWRFWDNSNFSCSFPFFVVSIHERVT